MIVGSVDFGGTKLMVGLVDDRGQVLSSRTVPTPVAGGPAAVADEAAALLRDLAGERLGELAGVGATVPGLADGRAGLLRYAPAHGWRDVPFAQMLTDRLGLRTRIANDVNACALAEQRFGAGLGVANLVWITVSTGVGGGLVLGGQIYEGSGIAGEMGHIIVAEDGPLCGCGHRGCLEAVAAGPAIARRAVELGLRAPDARTVADLAAAGEPTARQVLDETAVYLGRAIALCYNLLDPDLIVLGGGVSPSLEPLLPRIAEVVAERAILLPGRAPQIRRTALGYEAALIGAACLVLP